MGPIAYLRQKLLNIELQRFLKKFRNFLKGLRTALDGGLLLDIHFYKQNMGKSLCQL